MDPNLQVMEKSIDSNAQDEAGRSIDTSFAEEMVVENPTSSSVTHKDVEAIQALESTDILQTSVKATMILKFPVLGCFSMYCLTVSQARKLNQKN